MRHDGLTLHLLKLTIIHHNLQMPPLIGYWKCEKWLQPMQGKCLKYLLTIKIPINVFLSYNFSKINVVFKVGLRTIFFCDNGKRHDGGEER